MFFVEMSTSPIPMTLPVRVLVFGESPDHPFNDEPAVSPDVGVDDRLLLSLRRIDGASEQFGNELDKGSRA